MVMRMRAAPAEVVSKTRCAGGPSGRLGSGLPATQENDAYGLHVVPMFVAEASVSWVLPWLKFVVIVSPGHRRSFR